MFCYGVTVQYSKVCIAIGYLQFYVHQTVIAMGENESGSKIKPCRLHNTDSSSISELTLGNRQTSQSD